MVADRAAVAGRRWAAMLAGWSIPDELVASAPESPYFFDPEVFIEIADTALARREDTPSDAVAREVLPPSGTVLDIGVGAGAASLRLDPGRIVGVDPSSELLAAFAERAGRRGVEATTIAGQWPDVASQVPMASVVVCHHVIYNVADFAAFAAELSAHARRRVVVELTTVHPMGWMAPYWEALHGLPQPDRPTVEDAIDVLAALGISDVRQERWARDYQMIGESGPDQLARVARRLCLSPMRHEELRRLLVAIPPPREREVATLWWSPTH
jgi:cyclopropane fatty-acyl-phospholipid synthase-like methyltransferase